MRRSIYRTLAGLSIAGSILTGVAGIGVAGIGAANAAADCSVHVKSLAVCITNDGGRHAAAMVLNYPQNSNALAGAGVYCSNRSEHLVVVVGLWGSDEEILPVCLP